MSFDLGAVASDTALSLIDDGRLVGRIDVDQRFAASRFTTESVFWKELGCFQIVSHTIQVHLRDRADGIVLADAVCIVRVNVRPEGARSLIGPSSGGELTVLEGHALILDGVSELSWLIQLIAPISKTFVIRNDGNGPLRIDDLAVIPLATLLATNYTLVKPTGLSPLTPISLSPGGSTFFILTLDVRTING